MYNAVRSYSETGTTKFEIINIISVNLLSFAVKTTMKIALKASSKTI